MEKLTESEIYIIDSLFERKQIDKQRLIKAISILPETLIGDVLNSLTEGIVNITSSNIKEPISTYILKDTPNKLLTIKEIKDFYNIGLREAKDIVDEIPSVLDTTLRVGNEVIDKSKTPEFQNFILRLKDIGCTIDLILK
jgi:ribosomal protein L7/L12